MNFQVLSQVVEELHSLIIGARVERVYQGADGVYLVLDRGKKRRMLLLSPDRAQPRLHLVTAKQTAAEPVHPFVQFLRSRLAGAQITGVSLLNDDRIVKARFSRQGKECALLFELIGTSANLILVDPSLQILAVYFPVPPSDHAARALLPNMQYILPEKRTARAFEKPSGSSDGETVMSPSRSAELFYVRQKELKRIQTLRAGLLSSVKKSLTRSERLAAALAGDLRSADRAEAYRLAGDLVLANMHRLRTGLEQAELTGYDGRTMTVSLDPTSSPARNAEHYFKKYKKARAGREIIATRLRQADDAVAYLQPLLPLVKNADDADVLNSIRSELASRGYLRAGAGQKRTVSSGVASLPFKTVVYQGWDILIGRNAAGNDYVTTRIARPEDLWLHAEGLPGSHVLVRNPEGRDIPREILMKAAALAAFYSKGRTSGKVSVTYTRAGFVRKPRGAKPGLVSLTDRKSLMVKPEDA